MSDTLDNRAPIELIWVSDRPIPENAKNLFPSLLGRRIRADRRGGIAVVRSPNSLKRLANAQDYIAIDVKGVWGNGRDAFRRDVRDCLSSQTTQKHIFLLFFTDIPPHELSWVEHFTRRKAQEGEVFPPEVESRIWHYTGNTWYLRGRD